MKLEAIRPISGTLSYVWSFLLLAGNYLRQIVQYAVPARFLVFAAFDSIQVISLRFSVETGWQGWLLQLEHALRMPSYTVNLLETNTNRHLGEWEMCRTLLPCQTVGGQKRPAVDAVAAKKRNKTLSRLGQCQRR